MLAVLLIRRRNNICQSEKKTLKTERGLIITSLVSYVFYSLYLLNSVLAIYFKITICGYAQFLFLGLASMTPFCCLVMFAPSIRRFAFKKHANSI
ncbi:hypothetical protein PMAYCL1PPCAC_20071, partial [Pristionchus mayeri]